jgi:two-component system LytT family response regulator
VALVNERAASIRALVVDDEPIARRNLTILLRSDPDIGSIEECGSGAEAIEVIRRWKPDLVFLDVQMPECGGFDMIELLGAELQSAIIFVTAYDEYALRAFEAGALDYLVKPFDDGRFDRALNRAKDKLAHYGSPPSQSIKRLRATTPASMWSVTLTSSAGRWRSSSAILARTNSFASTAPSS